MKRIFIAVDISPDARRAAAHYIETLRAQFREVRVGWDQPEKLHLTLKFVGDTDERQLSALEKIVEKAAREIARFKIQIAETGVFPDANKPRVLWIDVVDGQGNLAKINAKLEAECEKIGIARESRKFVPHLTIGRVREPAAARGLAQTHLENKIEPVEFGVSEIVIYESKLLPTGSIFRAISHHGIP